MINANGLSQWESVFCRLAARIAIQWLRIRVGPAFILTLTFPVCSGRLAEGGATKHTDIILLLWLACLLYPFFCQRTVLNNFVSVRIITPAGHLDKIY